MVGLGWARRRETAHVEYAAPMGYYTLGSAYWSLVCYEPVFPQRPPCTHTPAGQEEKFGWPPSHHKRRFICYQVDEPLSFQLQPQATNVLKTLQTSLYHFPPNPTLQRGHHTPLI
jgi:hypothetical protein